MNILDLFNVNFLFIDKDAHLLDSIRYKMIMQNSGNWGLNWTKTHWLLPVSNADL